MAPRAKLNLRPRKSALSAEEPLAASASAVTRQDEPVTASPRAAANVPRTDREGKRLIGAHLPIATWIRLRKLGTRLQRHNQQLLGEALDDLFVKYKRSPPKTLPEAGRLGRRQQLDRNGTKLIAAHFPVATWATLRDLGTEHLRQNQKLIEEALEDLFTKYEMVDIASSAAPDVLTPRKRSSAVAEPNAVS